jgi:putative ABC transport system ATP-binding protein
MNEIVLNIKDVWKSYNMKKAGILTVLKNINLEIKKGEFVAIAGPSGSGKSTMMNIIGALDIPSKGEIELQNKKISEMNEAELATLRGKTIGFIFQKFNLIPTLTALENVTLPNDFIDGNEKEAEERAIKILDGLGLGDRIYHKPGELSGGQQQRVAVARSLANNPEIILADEPTGNLDSKSGEYVMDFLKEMNEKQGKTIVLITHDLDLIHFASKIIYLKDGEIEKVEIRKENKKGGKKK